ncbi:unnamed protein product [Vitrella brassicaformis CCMP3155]|uniref:Uncharacterized protein n=1 Tax=Vitrella brassicaformis (strain CCMP3155) TaxID=1169540 RepID=A0A0G4EPK7_VITBC|nr:unnamed protein product [Vitrella brassicaformis CCMP3155]|eukprot:CEL99402.1 unnamed protein product [Vitrella brassicaformis CCMP3155]
MRGKKKLNVNLTAVVDEDDGDDNAQESTGETELEKVEKVIRQERQVAEELARYDRGQLFELWEEKEYLKGLVNKWRQRQQADAERLNKALNNMEKAKSNQEILVAAAAKLEEEKEELEKENAALKATIAKLQQAQLSSAADDGGAADVEDESAET